MKSFSATVTPAVASARNVGKIVRHAEDDQQDQRYSQRLNHNHCYCSHRVQLAVLGRHVRKESLHRSIRNQDAHRDQQNPEDGENQFVDKRLFAHVHERRPIAVHSGELLFVLDALVELAQILLLASQVAAPGREPSRASIAPLPFAAAS